jgi:thiamine biosynthesis lipoprotein
MLVVFQRQAFTKILLLVAVLPALLAAGCLPQKELALSGKTMGTTYHIKVVAGLFTSAESLQQDIDQRLVAINRSMSTYDPTSEISRFNAIQNTEETFSQSADFLKVLTVAAEIHRLTEGAWDGTLDPLITLWGFGRKGTVDSVPDQAQIDQALAHVGFDLIERDDSGKMRKTDPAVTLDLASIAKGYGVDAVSRLLGDKGFENFLVEIGGEVYARGHRKDGKIWQVGINRPDRDAAFTDVYKALGLTNQAMATSGDYRIFFKVGDQFYSHIIDPRTGRPETSGVVSATVVAANCTFADGLATALMVMGPEKGVALVDGLPSVECLIVVRQPDGRFVDHPSKGFILER